MAIKDYCKDCIHFINKVCGDHSNSCYTGCARKKTYFSSGARVEYYGKVGTIKFVSVGAAFCSVKYDDGSERDELLHTLVPLKKETEKHFLAEYKSGESDSNDQHLTREQVEQYLIKQGYCLDDFNKPIKEHVDWFLYEPTHKEQIAETVLNNYDVCDFDRWMKIQRVLFGNEAEEIPFKTAMEIAQSLWEENIEVLDLCDYAEKDEVQASCNDPSDIETSVSDFVHSFYRSYDLKISSYEDKIKKLTNLIMKEIQSHSCLKSLLQNPEQMNFFVMQMALENL